jgi:predicted RNase H-like nuclease (RuvC/YqgF family)
LKIIVIYYLNLENGRSSTHCNLSVNRRFLKLENIIRYQDARISDLVNTNQQLVNTNQQLETRILSLDARISDLVNTNQQLVNTNQQLETRILSLDARVISLENDLQEERNQTPQRLFGNFTFNFLENGNSRLVKNRKLNKYIYIYIFIVL